MKTLFTKGLFTEKVKFKDLKAYKMADGIYYVTRYVVSSKALNRVTLVNPYIVRAESRKKAQYKLYNAMRTVDFFTLATDPGSSSYDPSKTGGISYSHESVRLH